MSPVVRLSGQPPSFLTTLHSGSEAAWHALLDLIYPPRCVSCGRIGSYYCDDCQTDLHFIKPPVCARCGQPLTHPGLCHICRKTTSPLDAVRSVVFFGGSIRFAIHALKYRNLPQLGEPLGNIMVDYINGRQLRAQYLIPVPLHVERQKMRGYNQSALLAQIISRATGVPIVNDALVRHRHTLPQVTLNASQRWANVANAFIVKKPELVAGKRFLLIDDVTTTGATLRACAQALKEKGASSVWGFTLARARRKPHLPHNAVDSYSQNKNVSAQPYHNQIPKPD